MRFSPQARTNTVRGRRRAVGVCPIPWRTATATSIVTDSAPGQKNSLVHSYAQVTPNRGVLRLVFALAGRRGPGPQLGAQDWPNGSTRLSLVAAGRSACGRSISILAGPPVGGGSLTTEAARPGKKSASKQAPQKNFRFDPGLVERAWAPGIPAAATGAPGES